MFISTIKNEAVLVRSCMQVNQLTLPPNQSLKLTEPAVGDFTRAKQLATIGHDSPRADWLPSLRRFAAAA